MARTLLPEFKNYKESLEILADITDKLKEALGKESSLEFLPAWCFRAALRAEMLTLASVNGDLISSPLAWDEETGFPSHPSLAADAWSACNFLGGQNEKLKLLLRSFSGWTLFCGESIKCACGTPGFKRREVQYDIFVEHALSKENGGLLVKQMVAISSQDRKFLEKHFSWKTMSRAMNAAIVYLAQNRVSREKNGHIILEQLETESAQEFYDVSAGISDFRFGMRIMDIIRLEEI